MIPFMAEKNSQTETLPQTNNLRGHNPVHGREKLTNIDTSPKEQCERSRSHSWQRKTHKRRDTSPKPMAKEQCERSRSCSWQRKSHKCRDTSPKEQCVRSQCRSLQRSSHKHRDPSPKE